MYTACFLGDCSQRPAVSNRIRVALAAASLTTLTAGSDLTADGSGHWGSGENGVAAELTMPPSTAPPSGPKLTLRSHHFSPFVEALVGWHSLDSDLFQSSNGFGFMAGGGVDLNLTRHFAWRMIRGGFRVLESSVRSELDRSGDGCQRRKTAKWLVFRFGGKSKPPPVSASCTVNPAEVMVGEPATATATGSNFNPKHTLNYTWSSTGGQVAGKDNTASVDTNGVAGGSYTVTAQISDPKTRSQANCMATFAVKEPPKNPPTVSCSANPSTLQTGTSSTISCTCTSPDNAQVTVGGWTASSGSISGSGNTAALDTSGTSNGPITVTCDLQRLTWP